VQLLQVTPSSSKMIDPEFAYMGPLAFDPAKIIGELIIPYFASDGHEAAAGAAGSRAKQRDWLLGAIVEVWDTFSTK
jgi:5-methylthioribose kinase